jgi:hypothetical protein
MGLFSRGPSIEESFGNAIAAFGTGVLKLNEDVRKRVAPSVVAAAEGFIGNQSFSQQQKDSSLTMFKIISGTVGVIPSTQLDFQGQADEVREIIETSLPFNMPMVVMGPIRMVIEEYVTGQTMSEINYDTFDGSDARQLVNALMTAIEIVNTRCIQEPRKHTQSEVLCLAYFATVIAFYIREQLM